MSTVQHLHEARGHLERLRRLQALGDPAAEVALERQRNRAGVSLLDLPGDLLPAPVRVRKSLKMAGWTLRDVLDRSVSDVLRQPFIGRRTIAYLSKLLFALGHKWGVAHTRLTLLMPDPDSNRPWNAWSMEQIKGTGSVHLDPKTVLSRSEQDRFVAAFYRAYNMQRP